MSTFNTVARNRLIQAAAGLVVGGGAGFLIGRLLKQVDIDPGALTWSDQVAGLLAAMLLSTGLVLIVGSFNAKMAARMIDPSGERAARPAQIVFFRQQAYVLALAGVMLAIPVVAGVFWRPLSPELGAALMAGLVAMFLLQTYFNITVWTRADEMLRNMVGESGAVCFWVLQGALFLWAAAEKLGLAPALTAWDMMTVLMAFYLVVSSILSVRRGFA